MLAAARPLRCVVGCMVCSPLWLAEGEDRLARSPSVIEEAAMSDERTLKDEDITTSWRQAEGGSAGHAADPDGTDSDGTDADGTDSDSDTTDS